MLKTGRFDTPADIQIDHERCTMCLDCITVCKGGPLYSQNGRIRVDQTRFFGCTGCGHCMAICPTEAVVVTGRDITPADIEDLSRRRDRATFDGLSALMRGRRSIREFDEREVSRPIIDKIIDTAATAPMGIPPSDVELLVLAGRDKVREFSRDMIDEIRRTRWMVSPGLLSLLRPIMGKDRHSFVSTFVVPLITTILKKAEAGEDWLLYDAPLAILFHTSVLVDPSDGIIAATYAMLAAESLGLGGCMIGGVGPSLKRAPRRLKEKYGIPPKNRPGLTLVLGYPKVEFSRAIKRRFSGVRFY